MIRTIAALLSLLIVPNIFAQRLLTDTRNSTLTAQHIYSGSNKLCLKDPSDTDKACLNAPALGSATVSLTLPATAGTIPLDTVFVGDSGSGGVKGLVPAPATGDATKVLSGAGTWINAGSISGAVSSVSNSDSSLTISPTTGAVVASLNVGHANTWTGQQTFNTSAPVFGTMTSGSVLFAGTSGVLSQANSTFFWANADGSLKIGTNSTTQNTYPLHALKNTNGDAGLFVENPNTGTSAATVLRLLSSSGTGLILYKWGSGYTGGGGDSQVAQGATLKNHDGPLGIVTQGASALYLGTTNTTRVTVAAGGDVNFGAVGSETFKWDAANSRLNLFNATSTAGNDIYAVKTVNGQVGMFLQNNSTGTAGYSIIGVSNSTPNSLYIVRTSTGYTTNGLIVADQSLLQNSSGSFLILQSANADTIFANAGNATSNETFRIKTTGVVVKGALAIPAGGTAATGLMFSSTANFGIFFGSGAPTLSAAKGSIYLRSDGSGTGDRIYVNSNGSTGWVAITTAS